MKQAPWMGFSIERGSDTPIFEQICRAIRAQVAAGELSEGMRLPPTRVFATELGVSRSTLVTAYEQLVAEGYLTSLRGSGYRVSPVGDIELAAAAPPAAPEVAEPAEAGPRPFRAGLPDMRLFPYQQWAKTLARVCRTNPQSMLVGAGVKGNLALRRAVAGHVAEWRGIAASPQQIVITAGSGDALELCIRTLTAPGESIGLEDPGYPPLVSYVTTLGLRTSYLAIDASGARLPQEGEAPSLVVLTPSHQYPLGGAMSPSRRLAFARWAAETNGWIVEDDYDSEFRYAGRPIPAMAGFDRLSRTIYVGSFSKIFSNQLRLGYVIVPEALLARFTRTLERQGVKASLLPQQALAEFIDQGEFYRHLRRMRRIYGERRRYLLTRLAADFGCYGSFDDHQAGMQVAFRFEAPLDDARVAAEAERRGLFVRPLSRYCALPRDLNGLLLGFCAYSEAEMGEALDRLGALLAEGRARGRVSRPRPPRRSAPA